MCNLVRKQNPWKMQVVIWFAGLRGTIRSRCRKYARPLRACTRRRVIYSYLYHSRLRWLDGADVTHAGMKRDGRRLGR